MIKKLFAIVLLAACLFSLAGCKKEPPKEVAGFLYSDYDGLGCFFYFQRYVDLQAGKIWTLDEEHGFPTWTMEDLQGADPAALGFSPVCALAPKPLKKVQKACSKSRPQEWEDRNYYGIAKTEGRWSLSIIFTDGSTLYFHGQSGSYPEGLHDWGKAFLDETGYSIFHKNIAPEETASPT